jgi:hypothetical protein
MNKKQSQKTEETNAKIYEEIRNRAKTISDDKKVFLEKIEADKDLSREIFDAKIKFILNIMIGDGIIDAFDRISASSSSDISYGTIRYTISKKNCSNVVHIITNGEHLVLREGGFIVDYGVLGAECVRCDKIDNIKEYDWISFLKKLLDFIYKTIYNNEKINDLYIFGG